jgi:transcription termination/antitermination protein NusA
MSQEIVDAVRALAREKGISEEKLITALEDALLSAYKKQPDAVRYARVHLDPDLGEYRVEELILPEELEDRLLDEAEEQATGELERRVDPETGEVIIPEAPEISLGSPSSRTRSRHATSRPTTSAGSQRRPPSR